MGIYDHVLDSAAVPLGTLIGSDFTRQDDATDGGAFDYTAVASGTIAILAGDGGWAKISAVATTDASGGQVQAVGGHSVATGKNIIFKAAAKLNESSTTDVATQSQEYIGLFPVDTSIDASLPDDGVYFVKADGANTVQCVTRVGGTNQAATTIPTDDFIMDKNINRYGITVMPGGNLASNVEFNINGRTVARHTNVSLPASTVFLTPSLAFRSGDTNGTRLIESEVGHSVKFR